VSPVCARTNLDGSVAMTRSRENLGWEEFDMQFTSKFSKQSLCQSPLRSVRFLTASAIGAAVVFGATPAHALVIQATYGTQGNGSPAAFTADQKATLDSVIALYQNTFSDAVTVKINVNNQTTGLGQSSTPGVFTDYATFTGALTADKTTANDNTALAQLTALPGSGNVAFTTANARALGFTGAAVNPTADGTIGLNGASCFTRSQGPQAGLVDLFGVFAHELDEVLGTSSGLAYNNSGTPTAFTQMSADLYRYGLTAGGAMTAARSYNLSATARAGFSIDGTNMLEEYNNTANGGDYGDWVRHTPAQVQDWQGTANVLVNPGNGEFTLLDVVGWDRTAAPEPSTLLALGLGAVVLLRRRRAKKQ
jgi:hypothetical protein